MIGTAPGNCAVSCASLPQPSGEVVTLNQGTYNNTVWNVGTNNLELNSAGKLAGTGYYLAPISDAGQITTWTGFNWSPVAPYQKELPDNKVSETFYSAENANMNGNVLLLHLNESSGNIMDASGSNNNGTAYNVTYNNAGKFKTALGFNGTNSYVQINDNSSLRMQTALTMEAWVKTTANRSGKIFQKGDWDGFGLYQDLWNGWSAGIQLANGTGSSLKWASGQPVLNKWYHLAATYDGSNFRLYVNGQQVSSAALSGQIKVTTRSVSLGSDNGAQKFFAGVIDETALFNRALTASEISENYNRGAERLNFQLRSCDDPLCAGETFSGPDGTAGSYYSDLNNYSLGRPSFSLTGIPDNRYFQYKLIMETDLTSKTPQLINATAINALGSVTGTTAAVCIDLHNLLVPKYLADIPADPQGGSQAQTYYAVSRLNNKRIEVSSCNAELNEKLVVAK
jgi:hypothetical protein